MPRLSETVARLAALRQPGGQAAPAPSGKLRELRDFGSNPGALRGWSYVPKRVGPRPPLVVVLHGCTQTADGYDTGAGWSQLAERHGFALLFPEQQRQNNPNGCFNWFAPGDIRRGGGEALSIREMVAAMVRTHDVAEDRIFVTGLSAGGAMAAVMLATYPELFAGGAIIAGLPYGCATTVMEALERMRGHGMPSEDRLASLARDASPHRGPWPTLSVWHGSGDATVYPGSASAIVGQWRALHGLSPAPTRRDQVDGYPRQLWCDAAGRVVIEEYSVTGMGHGTPLAATGPDGTGASGAFMLEAGISSTRHIAAFWGLLDGGAATAAPEPAPAARTVPILHARRAERVFTAEAAGGRAAKPEGRTGPAAGVGKVIEDALRAAGLMR